VACSPVTSRPTSPVAVSTWAASAATVTDSVSAPTSSRMLTESFEFTFRTRPVVMYFLKPGVSTEIWYVPMGRLETT
jgi:hypothetical protein